MFAPSSSFVSARGVGRTVRACAALVLVGLLLGGGFPSPAEEPAGAPAPQPSDAAPAGAAPAEGGGLARLDLDGDGLLSRKEFEQSRIGRNRPAAFDRIDADGDGFLSGEELAVVRRRLEERAPMNDEEAKASEGLRERGAGLMGRRGGAVAEGAALDHEVGLLAIRAHLNLDYSAAGARGEAGDPAQKLDLYLPEGIGPFPVVVWLHGGGWARGDKANARPLAKFFTDAGYAFASVNYRLSPAVTHPEHVRDVAAAVAWLAARVGDYGGDPARMVVGGHSAGAHLAALVATDPSRLAEAGAPADVLKGVVLLDGAAYDVAAQIAVGSPAALGGIYEQAFTTDPATQRDASPIFHVSPDRPCPPFLVFHIEQREDAREQGGRLAEALRAAGGTADVVAVADRTHASIVTELPKFGDPVGARFLDFLVATVGRGAIAPASPTAASDAAAEAAPALGSNDGAVATQPRPARARPRPAGRGGESFP